MSGRHLLSSALLIAALAAGCATTLAPPRSPLSEPARRAVDLLRARWEAFSDLRALADIVIQRGNRKEPITGALLLKRPDSLRFEALSPFGQPLLIATVHDSRIVTYDVGANAATVGAATPEAAAGLFGIAVEPEHLVGLLAGLPVPPADLRVAEILPPDEHGPSLELVGRIHRQRVWMDFATGVVRRAQLIGGRLDALLIYRRAGDGTIAGFELSAAQENVTGTATYRNVTVNSGLEAERFTLTIPPGASIERLR